MADLIALTERVEGREKACEHCGAIYRRRPHHTKRLWAKQRFCSQGCAGRHANAAKAMTPDEMRNDICSTSFINLATGCWISRVAPDSEGYPATTWNGRAVKLHRVSYELFCGPIPAGLSVCHECDNRRCVNPKHLFVGTNADNTADRNAKGRQSRGEAQGRAKLTEADVRMILASRETVKTLAARLGVAETTVGNVRRGTRWRHVAALRAKGGEHGDA